MAFRRRRGFRRRAPVRRRKVVRRRRVAKRDPYTSRYKQQKSLVFHTNAGQNPIPRSLDLTFMATCDAFLPPAQIGTGFNSWLIQAYPYQPFAGLASTIYPTASSPAWSAISGTDLTSSALAWSNYMVPVQVGPEVNGLFNQAYPMSSHLIVQFIAETQPATGLGSPIEVCLVPLSKPQDTDDPTFITSMQLARAMPNARSTLINQYEKSKLSCYTSTSKMEGLSRSQIIADPALWAGVLDAPPDYYEYYLLCVQTVGNNGSSNAQPITARFSLSVNCFLNQPAKTALDNEVP